MAHWKVILLISSTVCLFVPPFTQTAPNTLDENRVRTRGRLLHVILSNQHEFIRTLPSLRLEDSGEVWLKKLVPTHDGGFYGTGESSLGSGLDGTLRTVRSAEKKQKREKNARKRKQEKRTRSRPSAAAATGESHRGLDELLPRHGRVESWSQAVQLVSTIARNIQRALGNILAASPTQAGRETQQLPSQRFEELQEELPTISRRTVRFSEDDTKISPLGVAPTAEIHTTTGVITSNLNGDGRRDGDAQSVNISNVEFAAETDQRFLNSIIRRKAPYNNVVRLSLGCTGTLISPVHVLTAAHCVHNGAGYRRNAHRANVEAPSWYGFISYPISMIHVPLGWIKSGRTRANSGTLRAVYDYAVVTLLTPVAGNRRFPRFGVPGNSVISNPKFAGFPSEKQNQMWETSCPLGGNSDVVLGGNLLLADCRASAGSSGSAVFVTTVGNDREHLNDRRIAGLVSSSVLVNRKGRPKSKTRVTVINIITKRKRKTICAMMAKEDHYSIGEERHTTEVESCVDMSDRDGRNSFQTVFVDRLRSH